jgi:hypothetical protein
MQSPAGRVLIDPTARYVAGGATGRVDLYLMPSFDSVLIVREGGIWRLVSDDEETPLTRETFWSTVIRLLEQVNGA